MLKRTLNLGGCQLRTNDFLRDKSQTLRAENVHTNTVGSLTIRDGLTKIGSAISANDILSNFEFVYGATPTRVHLTKVLGTIYYNNSGTWTATSGAGTGLSTTDRTRMVTYLDTVFAANITDAMRSSADGITWSTSTKVTGAPKAKFVDVYRDFVIGAYVNYGGTTYRDRFVLSKKPTAANDITWDNTNRYYIVPIRNDDEITGVAVNHEHFLIFSRNTFFRFDGTFGRTSLQPVSWHLGAVSQDSIVTVDNITFAYSARGPIAYNGGKPKIIGRAVQQIIDRVNKTNDNLKNIRAGTDGDHVYWWLGDLTTALPGDAAALTNVVLDYNLANNDWTYHTYPEEITIFGNYTANNGAWRLSIGNDAGEIFTLNEGSNDDGVTINANIVHRIFPYTPEVPVALNFLYGYGSHSATDIDFQWSTDTVGDAEATFSTKKDLPVDGKRTDFPSDASVDAYGHKIGMKFTGPRTDNRWRLSGYTLDFKPSQPDTV